MFGMMRGLMGRTRLNPAQTRSIVLSTAVVMAGGIVHAKQAEHKSDKKNDSKSDHKSEHKNEHKSSHDDHHDDHHHGKSDPFLEYGRSAYRPLNKEIAGTITDQYVLRDDAVGLGPYKADFYRSIILNPALAALITAGVLKVGSKVAPAIFNGPSGRCFSKYMLWGSIATTALHVYLSYQMIVTQVALDPRKDTVSIQHGIFNSTTSHAKIKDIKLNKKFDENKFTPLKVTDNEGLTSIMMIPPLKEYRGVSLTHRQLFQDLINGNEAAISKMKYNVAH